ITGMLERKSTTCSFVMSAMIHCSLSLKVLSCLGGRLAQSWPLGPCDGVLGLGWLECVQGGPEEGRPQPFSFLALRTRTKLDAGVLSSMTSCCAGASNVASNIARASSLLGRVAS